MKIAVSSASFASAFSSGRLTHLEWLDACANELEVDGVVFDVHDFPRTDDEYLAQLKKNATDLGLTVAAIETREALPDVPMFAIALAIAAPIVIARAPRTGDDGNAWPAFVDAAKTCARAAKKANVVVALCNAPQTICSDAAELRRIAYDVDGSWLRFGVDPLAATEKGDLDALLPKAVIARTQISDMSVFATTSHRESEHLITSLARFRGFIVLDGDASSAEPGAYHAAIARFVDRRSSFLREHSEVAVKT